MATYLCQDSWKMYFHTGWHLLATTQGFRTAKKGRVDKGGQPVAPSLPRMAACACRRKPDLCRTLRGGVVHTSLSCHRPLVPSAASGPHVFLLREHPSMFSPGGICTCCSFCPESSEVGSPQVCLLLILWVLAQTLSPSRNLHCSLYDPSRVPGTSLSLVTLHHGSLNLSLCWFPYLLFYHRSPLT